MRWITCNEAPRSLEPAAHACKYVDVDGALCYTECCYHPRTGWVLYNIHAMWESVKPDMQAMWLLENEE